MRNLTAILLVTACLAQGATFLPAPMTRMMFGTPIHATGFTLEPFRNATPLTQTLIVGAWGGLVVTGMTAALTHGRVTWPVKVAAAVTIGSIFGLLMLGNDRR